ncbi:MAG: AbrB/MazE/SpoVT family DNA-binding domain-containing protein [Thaumarchaeota archaeon]|nr:AbrB/MazE/SpoVT family DNA-binding domain-containing protein [Nitrososphaerota archaeon]
MKLQKQSSRKVGNVEYPKWVVVIPPEKIKESGLKEGDELEVDVKDDKLLIKRKKSK